MVSNAADIQGILICDHPYGYLVLVPFWQAGSLRQGPSCEEYRDLNQAFAAYRAAGKQS